MQRLADKVAIATGATSGIGHACAELFVREDAKVVLAGRREEIGAAIAASLGANALFVRTDVTEEKDVEALVERTLRHFGRVDCVVSNAGAGSKTGAIAIVSTNWSDFEADLALHVRAASHIDRHLHEVRPQC